MAGTGAGGFAGEWAVDINHRMLVTGIRGLDHHAPAALRERWQRYRTALQVPDSLTTTVYHFGIAEDDSSVCAYAYRSANGFSSEPLPQGLAFKPDCTVPENFTLATFPSMMQEQRANERSKPEADRLYIGGDCIMMHLTKTGCSVTRLSRFDDYPEQLHAMCENLRSKEA